MDTEEDEEHPRRPSIIRKRTTTTSIFSSMITVPEENSTEQQQVAMQIESVPMPSSKETGGSKGNNMLDDSIRSGRTENSLVNKMKDVLNEEWWAAGITGGGSGGRSSTSGGEPPIQTLLLSDQHQLGSSDNQQRTTATKKKKSKTNRADFIFGMVLLTVGFIVGGVFIHRDKVLLNMTSLLSGTHSNKSQQQEGMRQLPIVQHQLTYEERQQLYREQKQAGMLRPINGRGKSGEVLGIDSQERMRFQQYQGFDQLERGE
eukprot:CAMPEP_0201701130 /NCGR_PEP_ID=MMETSP0578-20130828/31359_1 /ASSEMBLY_ACC=CAM_ASM_000663 /TAXON_ID=267565 /ORGANISM="Skeletonema grethea, Strain CCMP 1804" /LENGTH=259 /DNA_ID=CAMNT_0048188359 /DNA_START=74 /DNA_END=853 /DNA_ORIENTATION=-